MPFGIGRKDKDGEDLDAQKRSLFGGRSKSSKSSSPAPSSANPYAAPPPPSGGSNPYANQSSQNDPYAPKSQSNLSSPPTGSFNSMSLNGSEKGGPPPSYSGPGQFSRDKSPVPPGGYGGGPPRAPPSNGGYGQSSYGQGGGYGENPYGGPSSSSRGAGGYGGLGRSNSQETMGTEAGRNELFGDAAKRAQQQRPPPQEESQDTSYGNSGGFSSGGFDSTEMPGGYGPGLSAQEEEDQEVNAAKQEMNQLKREDVNTTRRLVGTADNLDQLATNIIGNIGRQGESFHNAEKNLDSANVQAKTADKKIRVLDNVANTTMFMPVRGERGNREKRLNRDHDLEMERHHQNKKIEEVTRAHKYADQQRVAQGEKGINSNRAQQQQKASLLQRSKYQFDADSEDDEMEDELDANLLVLVPVLNVPRKCAFADHLTLLGTA